LALQKYPSNSRSVAIQPHSISSVRTGVMIPVLLDTIIITVSTAVKIAPTTAINVFPISSAQSAMLQQTTGS